MCLIMNMLTIIKNNNKKTCRIMVSGLSESFRGVIFWQPAPSPSHLLCLSVCLCVALEGECNRWCTLWPVCRPYKISSQNITIWHSDEEWGELSKHKSCSWKLNACLKVLHCVCVYVYVCVCAAGSSFAVNCCCCCISCFHNIFLHSLWFPLRL